jgi:hypothetical protein
MNATADSDRPSRSLDLARAWYVVVGGAALLLTAGHAWGALAAGSRFDAPLVIGGIAVGILSLAAAAWVAAPGRWCTLLAWSGIVAGFAPLAVALWIAVTTASIDAQAFVGVPALIGLVAGLRMAVARAMAHDTAGRVTGPV